MAKTIRKRTAKPAADETRSTRDLLIDAATKEFNQQGFGGTDTNKIARRAGFAPQTFYRWFDDKTEIFLAVYREWEEQEKKMIGKLIAERASAADIAEAAVAHHRAFKIYRRSLRTLSLEDAAVRKARAESRSRQIEQIKAWNKPTRLSTAEIATILLQLERLSDAIAEDEFGDLGVDDKSARAAIANLQRSLRG